MDTATALRIFQAQSSNVKALDTARRFCKRAINRDLVEEDLVSLSINTRFYAMLFSAWSEAKLQKMVFTPYGLSLHEIKRVQKSIKSNIEQGFLECLEICLPKVFGHKNTSFKPNARRRLGKLIKEYIVTPYEMRNKFAHGQWATATTANFSDIHLEMTARISVIDAVEIDRWYLAHEGISHLLEMLICSPKKGFTQQYWTHVLSIEERLKEAEGWSLAEKKKLLLKKGEPYRTKLGQQAALTNWVVNTVVPELSQNGQFTITKAHDIPEHNLLK